MIITAYVDDMLIASPSREKVDWTKQEIMHKWQMEDNRQIKEFLSIKITWNRDQKSMTLDLASYVKVMVHKWLGQTTEKSWIPMQSIAGGAKGDKCLPQRSKEYQELVGQLLWVLNTVQPDISFTVGTLARHMSTPNEGAWNVVIHILKYINQTSDYRLCLGGRLNKEDQAIVTYTNANWASDPTNGQRSTSGAMTYLYRCPVSW